MSFFACFFFPLQSAEFTAKQRKLQYLEHPAFARQTQQVNIFEHVLNNLFFLKIIVVVERRKSGEI